MNHNDLAFILIVFIVTYDLFEYQKFFLNGYVLGSIINYYLNKFLNKNTDLMNDREDEIFCKPSLLIQHISYSIMYLFQITEKYILIYTSCIILFTLILIKIKLEENNNLQILSGIIFGLFIGYINYYVLNEIITT